MPQHLLEHKGVKQLKEKGFDVKLRALEREIADRDAQDRSRPVSPLVPAGDAIVLDTSHKGIGQVFAEVTNLVDDRLGSGQVYLVQD